MSELRRRNVFRVAIAYVLIAWIILEAGDVLAPALHLPAWVVSALVFFLVLGFPLALVFAWAFELTPEGIKLEKHVDHSRSITHLTGRRLDFFIIGVLVVALVLFAFDEWVLERARDAHPVQATAKTESEQTVESDRGETPERSIAVLAFADLSPEGDQEYLSDGLSEELLNLLAKVPNVRVTARTSSFSFKDQNLEIPAIAERLNVAYVLEGSVRKAGSQIRITVQLINAEDGFHVWSETYDRRLDDVFQVQDDIAAAVVSAMKVTLLGEPPKTKETDLEAYQLYLKGQFFGYQRTEESTARAIDLFKRALEIDPGYTPARAELAYNYFWYAALGGMSIDEGNALADQAIEMALNADPDYAWTYFVRGNSRVFHKFDFKAGIEDFQRAVRLDPGNAVIVSGAGEGARALGRLDEAIDHYLTALELDPVMAEAHYFLGRVYLGSGRLEDAEASFRKTLSVSPRFAGARSHYGRVLLRQGRPTEALAEVQRETNSIYRNTGLAMVHHVLGNHQESDRAVDNLIREAAAHAAFQIAEVYGFRGDVDKAFEWLDKSLEIRDPGLASLLGDPAFRGLVSDPRWISYLDKLGLLDAWRDMPPEYGGPAR